MLRCATYIENVEGAAKKRPRSFAQQTLNKVPNFSDYNDL